MAYKDLIRNIPLDWEVETHCAMKIDGRLQEKLHALWVSNVVQSVAVEAELGELDTSDQIDYTCYVR